MSKVWIQQKLYKKKGRN